LERLQAFLRWGLQALLHRPQARLAQKALQEQQGLLALLLPEIPELHQPYLPLLALRLTSLPDRS